jgi:hypothetical protein
MTTAEKMYALTTEAKNCINVKKELEKNKNYAEINAKIEEQAKDYLTNILLKIEQQANQGLTDYHLECLLIPNIIIMKLIASLKIEGFIVKIVKDNLNQYMVEIVVEWIKVEPFHHPKINNPAIYG